MWPSLEQCPSSPGQPRTSGDFLAFDPWPYKKQGRGPRWSQLEPGLQRHCLGAQGFPGPLSGRRDMHRWKAPWVSVENQPLFLKWVLGLSHD